MPSLDDDRALMGILSGIEDDLTFTQHYSMSTALRDAYLVGYERGRLSEPPKEPCQCCHAQYARRCRARHTAGVCECETCTMCRIDERYPDGTAAIEPKPPAELVAFAERHGVEAGQASDETVYCMRAKVGDVNVEHGKPRGEPAHYQAWTEDHMVGSGATIDEALAKLAAATVDDVEAHLEVVGLIENPHLDGVLMSDLGYFLATESPNGAYGKTPWLAHKAALALAEDILRKLRGDDNA